LDFHSSRSSFNRSQFYRAFQQVLSIYQEKAQSSGTIPVMDYATNIGAGEADHTGSSSLVRPSVSDFLCDVEIAGRRALTDSEFAYFKHFYLSGEVVVYTQGDINQAGSDFTLDAHIESFREKGLADAVASLDRRVREKVGQRLFHLKISPLSAYMEPVDVRGLRTQTDGKEVESETYLSLYQNGVQSYQAEVLS
jgi:hypothetical protein